MGMFQEILIIEIIKVNGVVNFMVLVVFLIL